MRYITSYPLGRLLPNKIGNNKCWWRTWRNWNPIHSWWEWKMVQPLWNSIVVPQKSKTTMAIWSRNSASRYISKELKTRSQSDICTYFHSSIIHKSQKVAAVQISTGRWVDKENADYTYNRTQLFKKKGNSDTYNTDEPLGHYTKWSNPIK